MLKFLIGALLLATALAGGSPTDPFATIDVLGIPQELDENEEVLGYPAYAMARDDATGTTIPFTGTLGLEFDVTHPINVTQLGAFDDSGDGISGSPGIKVTIYNRVDGSVVVSEDITGTGDAQFASYVFKTLDEVITLPRGFKGVVAASGFDTTNKYGSGTRGTDVPSVTGGYGVEFTGRGRHQATADTFPDTDSVKGYANVYAAGNFVFRGASTPAFATKVVAGNEVFTGSLGLDFDVGSEAIIVTDLGFFDSDQDGIQGSGTTIHVQLFNRETEDVLAALTFTQSSSGNAVKFRSYRKKALLNNLWLPAGFKGSIVASGFSSDDQALNMRKGAVFDKVFVNELGGAIKFVGNRFGGSFASVSNSFPTTPAEGPDDVFPMFGAGTFFYGASELI